MIPTLLTWPHSVLVHDLKGENWALTAGARKRMGQLCLKFAPASADSDGARFNPLAEVRLRTPNEIRDVRNIVQMIIDPDGKGLPDHWSRAGSEAFDRNSSSHQLYEGRDQLSSGRRSAALRSGASRSTRPCEQIMRAEHDPHGSLGWKDSHGNPDQDTSDCRRARCAACSTRARTNGSGVISEVKGFLELYRDPVIAANTAVSDFRIDGSDESPAAAFRSTSSCPLAHKDSLQAADPADAGQILHRLTERLEYRDGRAVTGYRHRLLLMIDEFPSLGRLDMFADSLSLVAGYGIKACLIAQDLSQIHAAYGHDEAITSNCHTRVAFSAEPDRNRAAALADDGRNHGAPCASDRISSSGASVSEPEVARPCDTRRSDAARLQRGVDLHQRTAGDSRDQASVLHRAVFQTAREDSSRRRKAIVSRTQLPSGRPRAQ